VFFEDIDVISDPNKLEADEASRLLDSFDGIAAKGLDVLAVLTTNHIDRIHKGMVRPGRLDAVIELGALDAPNTLRLLLANIPRGLADKEDIMMRGDEVAEAHAGYSPAFVVESAGRAIRYAVSRTTAGRVPPINSTDLILSAQGLRNQLRLMEGASEDRDRPTLDAMLHKTVSDKVGEVTPPAIDKAFKVHLGR
jgi:transitional endoplasmic reticulum ATPase